MPPYTGTRGESVTIDPGDIEIGAVELKDHDSDQRVNVDAAGALLTGSPAGTTSDGGADITVDATAGGVSLLAANASRKSAVIQNTGAAAMRVRIDGDPSTTRGVLVSPGDALVLSGPNCPTGAIKAIRHTSSSTTAYAVEVV